MAARAPDDAECLPHRCNLVAPCAHKLPAELPKRARKQPDQTMLDLALGQFSGTNVTITDIRPTAECAGQYVVYTRDEPYLPPAAEWHRQQSNSNRYWENSGKTLAVRILNSCNLNVTAEGATSTVCATFVHITHGARKAAQESRWFARGKRSQSVVQEAVEATPATILAEVRAISTKIDLLAKEVQDLKRTRTDNTDALRNSRFSEDIDEKMQALYEAAGELPTDAM